MNIPVTRHVFIILTLLCGCVAGGYDSRFSGVAGENLELDGYPIVVTLVKVGENVYDVESRDGRAIGFTGLTTPLISKDRFRRAAIMVMRNKFGDAATIKTLDEDFPFGSAHLLFIRYEVTQ